MKISEKQKKELLLLLWDWLKVAEVKDCESVKVLTGYGVKTKEGLLASIENILTSK